MEQKLMAVPPQPSKELLEFLGYFNGKHYFQALNRHSLNHSHPPKQFPTDIYSAYTYLYELQKDGYEVYFVVNEVSGNVRREEFVNRARAVFIDDDTKREGGPRTDFLLKPSLIVETSEGKYHYYWITSTTNLSEWKSVQEALIHIYKTDGKIKDPPRIMRLPTFKHYTGFISRIVGGNKKHYTWEEIVLNYPPLPKEAITDEFKESLGISGTRTKAEMIKIIVEGKANSGLHDATRDLAWGMLKDGEHPHKVVDYLKALMSGYDMSNIRHRENYSIIDRTVMSAAKKLKAEGNIPDKETDVYPMERDWTFLLENNIAEDCVPKSVWRAAKEVGDFTSAGEVPAILSAVVITSALLNKNVIIHEIDNSLIQRCRMGLIVAMHTGTVKTRVYQHMCKPFFDYQEKLQVEWEESKFRNEGEILALKAKKQKELTTFKNAESFTSSEERAMLDRIEAINRRIEYLERGKPYLYIDDSTEERLIQKMADNDGTMAVLSDDARNTIKNIAGMRYTGGVGAEGTYICGLTGSTIDSHRAKDGGSDVSIPDPVLNLLLFIQPDLATKFKQSDVYLESGLAARIPIYYYPITGETILKGREKRKRQTLRIAEVQPYYDALYRLCHTSIHFPLVVRLSESAKKRHIEMDHEFSQMLADKWRGHYDKTNKVSTLVVTYATVFAAIDDPTFGDKLEQCSNNSDTINQLHAAPEVAVGESRTLMKKVETQKPTFSEITYELGAMYVNMAWEFAKTIFTQSIESYEELDKHPIVQMSREVIAAIDTMYAKGKIVEGFPECTALGNMLPVKVRKDLPEIMTHLVDKGWLLTAMRTQIEGRGKLNGGTPNKIVRPGDIIYHLNIEGIRRAKKKLAEGRQDWGETDYSLLMSLKSGG
jgi:hypothetical protein